MKRAKTNPVNTLETPSEIIRKLQIKTDILVLQAITNLKRKFISQRIEKLNHFQRQTLKSALMANSFELVKPQAKISFVFTYCLQIPEKSYQFQMAEIEQVFSDFSNKIKKQNLGSKQDVCDPPPSAVK